MEVDLPDVVAEVREVFERYEKALVTNDVATLDTMFRKDERTIRYGVAENLYGHSEVAAFRAARSPINLARTRERVVDHHLRPRLRRRLHALPPRQHARQDRPADADLGALPGRLAGGRGARQPHRCAQELTPIGADDATRHPHRHPRSARGLRAGARPRGGGRVRVRRHRQGGRPRHLHLARRPEGCAPGRAASSGASMPPPSRCGASRSPSRTTSTWRGCRPRRPAPRSPIRPRRARLRSSGSSPPARYLIGKTNLDQFATGLVGVRTPYPVPRNAFDPDDRAGRLELRARPSRWRGGSCPSRSAPTRRARAACRPASTTSSGSSRRWVRSRPAAWCRPAARSTACRCSPAPSTTPGPSTLSWRARTRPIPSRGRSRSGALTPAPPAPVIGIPRPADQKFFGDAAARAAWRASLKVLKDLGATLVEIDMTPFNETAALLYEGPWVAERFAAVCAVPCQASARYASRDAADRRRRPRVSPPPMPSRASTGWRR